MNILAPLTVPLLGRKLIEASAGTGKTFTIALLYLRYLLGLTEQGIAYRAEQILVVTFTKAATAELRARIRQRIVDMITALTLGTDDAFLAQLLAKIDQPKLALQRLQLAAKSMDDAAIFTIHGFCQRMLKQHAFACNSGFDAELTTDEGEWLTLASNDFWRQHIALLTTEQAQWLVGFAKTPEQLLALIRLLLAKSQLHIKPSITLSQFWEKAAELSATLATFQRNFGDVDCQTVLASAQFKGNVKQGKVEYQTQLARFCQRPTLDALAALDIWHEQTLASETLYKKGGAAPDHPLFSELSNILDGYQSLQSEAKAAIINSALSDIRLKLARYKNQEGFIGTDDLLVNLEQALAQPSGQQLALAIARQYPIALIDEFQDTDPIQYGIFSRIYQSAGANGLTMIGDPKQAIYGFRGADIHTYLAAKADVPAAQRYTLDTNFRSHQQYLSAVNQLFTLNPEAFMAADLPFTAVRGGKALPEVTLAQQPQPAMCWHVINSDAALAKSAAMPVIAKQLAVKISNILSRQDALIGSQPIHASDLCVLVRDRVEADVIKTALREQGVASVFLSRAKVFDSTMSVWLYELMVALLEPKEEALWRAVLLSPLFSRTIADIAGYLQHDGLWQQQLDLKQHYLQLWQRFGVLTMLETLLAEQQLVHRWQNQQDGERWLTDYRHLAELLQQQSLQSQGPHRLLRWFNSQRTEQVEQEHYQQRLESDSALVQIVTMHASKGLEYPIVFIPFVLSVRKAALPLYHANGQTLLDFSETDTASELADQQRLAEDVRLLYVALTRPIYQCHIWLYRPVEGRSKSSLWPHTGFGQLLPLSETQLSDAPSFSQALATIAHSAGIAMSEQQVDEHADIQKVDGNTENNLTLCAREFTGEIAQHWRVLSFTGLTRFVEESPWVKLDEGIDWQAQLDATAVVEPVLNTPFTFAKGAHAGQCLHDLLEYIPFNDFATPERCLPIITPILRKYGFDEVQWADVVQRWLNDVVNTEFPAMLNLNTDTSEPQTPPRLSQIDEHHCFAELEFLLPVSHLDANQLAALLAEYGYSNLQFSMPEVKGMLTGFMDLLFIDHGKYYLVDYKSNYLGADYADYQPESLAKAMQEHHYQLQYILYCVAIYQLLSITLNNFDYDRDFAGCYYLFIRGMHPERTTGIFADKPAKALIEQLHHRFFSAPATRAAVEAL